MGFDANCRANLLEIAGILGLDENDENVAYNTKEAIIKLLSINRFGPYECHITVPEARNRQEHQQLEELGTANKWKTSYIIGDPLLGKDGFFYFTAHHVTYARLFKKMENLAELLTHAGFHVVRKKIEQIVYDTKRINS